MSVATGRPGAVRRNVWGRLAGPAAAGAAACAGFAVAPLTPVPDYVSSGSAGLAGLSLVAGVAAYRSARRDELVSSVQVGLSALIGSPAQTRVKPGRWRGGFVGVPHRLTVWFDSQARTHDPKWSPQLLEICKARTGLAYTVKAIDHRRSRLTLGVAAGVTALASTPEQRRAERTIGELLGPTAKVTAMEMAAGQLVRIRATHQNGTRLANSGYRARVERTLSAVLPGRWRAKWDLQADTVVFEHRPSFAKTIWLEPSIRNELDDVLSTYDDVAIEYGEDEDGNPAIWRPAIDPNLMVVGAPGTGKTVLEHVVLAQVSRYNWPIWVLDGKSIEFLGFRRDWPNVQVVATTVEHQVALVERAWQVMEHRYQLVTQGLAREEDFEPLMVFVDEWADFRANLMDWYVGVKQKGDPSVPPCLSKVKSISRKGRSARVHLLFATQRPDAEYFGADMRDNFRCRISMGRLSPQGAMMVWQDPSSGTTVPRNCRGRATTINDDNVPVEIQTFFIRDPRKATDEVSKEHLARVRPPRTLHERLVILPPELTDGEESLGYHHYAQTQWVSAASRPDLDPANFSQESAEGAREMASPLTVLGVDGRRPALEPSPLGRGGDQASSTTREPDAQDLFVGFGPAADSAPDEVMIGDLVLHPDLDEWVTVDAPVEEDVTEPLNRSIFWRDDNDEAGHLSVPADEVLSVRRSVDDEDEAA